MRGALTDAQAGGGHGMASPDLAIARYHRPTWAPAAHVGAAPQPGSRCPTPRTSSFAEMTAATSLLTTDARVASAPGIRCAVQLL